MQDWNTHDTTDANFKLNKNLAYYIYISTYVPPLPELQNTYEITQGFKMLDQIGYVLQNLPSFTDSFGQDSNYDSTFFIEKYLDIDNTVFYVIYFKLGTTDMEKYYMKTSADINNDDELENGNLTIHFSEAAKFDIFLYDNLPSDITLDNNVSASGIFLKLQGQDLYFKIHNIGKSGLLPSYLVGNMSRSNEWHSFVFTST